MPGHPEVRILVNGAGYKAPQVLPRPKHMREAVWERRRRLDRREGDLADVVLWREAERPPHLVHGYAPA